MWRHKQLSSGYAPHKNWWQRLHLDGVLLLSLLLLSAIGLCVLYSAANENIHVVLHQAIHLALAFTMLLIFAQIPPTQLKRWTPLIFAVTIGLLVTVLIIGRIGKGAQRWLDLGIFHFQPSELAKVAIPAMLAYYFSNKKLPPSCSQLILAGLLIFTPFILTAKQPDLGTAIILAISGGCVVLFAGISWRWLLSIGLLIIVSLPITWHFMHDYQRERVLTFLNPERDPLGSGYHIIQSKIAIGSGGIFGKGWLNGSQSHLHFLPEHTTDFIFAVIGEEWGLLGCIALVGVMLFIIGRGLYIGNQAQDTFSRLLAGSLTVNFFIAAFINMGMVSGIFPVVGIPLPMISYGGTTLIITAITFGILMSIHTHRKLIVRT